MTCDRASAELHSYIDGELDAAGVLQLESHLSGCERCRTEFESLCGVVKSVRRVRPLYDPTDATGTIHSLMAHDRRRRWIGNAAAVLALCGVLVLSIAGLRWFRESDTSRRFVAFAIDTHTRNARGLLPLDVASSEPRDVNGWLAKRLTFPFQLPNYRAGDADINGKRYSLRGVRLVQFANTDAAYVGYDMGRRPISLIAAPASSVVPAGGEDYRSGGLAFHLSKRGGLQVIAWTDRGVTYALVSDVTESKSQSCVVCHGAEADRHKIDNLRPLH